MASGAKELKILDRVVTTISAEMMSVVAMFEAGAASSAASVLRHVDTPNLKCRETSQFLT